MDKTSEQQRMMSSMDAKEPSVSRGQQVPNLLSSLPSEGSGRVLRFKSGGFMKLASPKNKTDASSPLSQPEVDIITNGERSIASMPIVESSLSVGSEERDAIAVNEIEIKETSSSDDCLIVQSQPDNTPSLGSENQNIVEFIVGSSSDGSCSASNRSSDCGDTIIQTSNTPPPPSYESVCKKETSNLQRNPSSLSVGSVQPPTYRDAVGVGRFLEDAPPNYHALFSTSVFRMIDFHGDHNGLGDDGPMTFATCIITYCLLSGIIVFGTCMALLLPLAMIIIGVAHLHSCPAQPRIPVFLTSMGVFQLLECCGRCSMYIYTKLKTRNQRSEVRYKSKDPFVYFIVVWFVVGSMWVYQNYPTCHDFIQSPNTQKNSVNDDQFVPANLTVHSTTDTREDHPHFFRTKPFSSRGSSTGTKSGSADTDDNVQGTKQAALQKQSPGPNNNHVTPPSMAPVTTWKPLPKPRAACCGKVVYFFTFGVVTLYYSMIGLWFMLNLCCTFVKMFHRCQNDQPFP